MIWLLSVSALAIPTEKNLGNYLVKIDISGALVPLVWLKAVIFASYLVKPQMCCMSSITSWLSLLVMFRIRQLILFHKSCTFGSRFLRSWFLTCSTFDGYTCRVEITLGLTLGMAKPRITKFSKTSLIVLCAGWPTGKHSVIEDSSFVSGTSSYRLGIIYRFDGEWEENDKCSGIVWLGGAMGFAAIDLETWVIPS